MAPDAWTSLAPYLEFPINAHFAGRNADFNDQIQAMQIGPHLERSALLVLQAAFLDRRGPRVVALIGGPGMGKSFTSYMLIQELQ